MPILRTKAPSIPIQPPVKIGGGSQILPGSQDGSKTMSVALPATDPGTDSLLTNPAVRFADARPAAAIRVLESTGTTSPLTGKIFDAPAPRDVDAKLTGSPKTYGERARDMAWAGAKAVVFSAISLVISPIALPAGLFVSYLADKKKIATTGSGGMATGLIIGGLLTMPMMAYYSITEFVQIARGTMADPKKAVETMTNLEKSEKERLAAFTRLKADYPKMSPEQRAAFTRATGEMITGGKGRLAYDLNKAAIEFLEAADANTFADVQATQLLKETHNLGEALTLCEMMAGFPADKRAIAFDYVLSAANGFADRPTISLGNNFNEDARKLYTSLAIAVAGIPKLRDECVKSYLSKATGFFIAAEDANIARLLFELLGAPQSLSAPVAKFIRDVADRIDSNIPNYYISGAMKKSYLPVFKDVDQDTRLDWLQNFLPGHIVKQRLDEWANLIEGKPLPERHAERIYNLVEDEFGVKVVVTKSTPTQEIEIWRGEEKLGTLNSAIINRDIHGTASTFASVPSHLVQAVQALLETTTGSTPQYSG